MLAALAAVEDQPDRSVRLSGAAESLREAIGAALPTVDQQERDDRLTALRGKLGSGAYGAAWEEGRAMPLEQATRDALKTARG
jgi:hypothetical protein